MQPEDSNQMTRQLSQELLALLDDPKVEVKHATFSAILQHTKTETSKMLFQGTTLFKHLLNGLSVPELTKLCLSVLIHFSSCEKLEKDFQIFPETIVFALRDWIDLKEQMALLLLLNISKFEGVVRKLIGEGEKGGLLIEALYGFMENKAKSKRQWVIVNIFVNITSFQFGRKFAAMEKIHIRFLQFINEASEALRLAVLRILRNVAFEWEDPEIIAEILKPQHKFIDSIALHIIVMILKSELLPNLQQITALGSKYIPAEELNLILKPLSTSEKKSLNQIEISIDIILIISNCNFQERKPEILKKELQDLVSMLKFTKIKEETKDKLQALETFCFW